MSNPVSDNQLPLSQRAMQASGAVSQKEAANAPYLEGLNPQQCEAVLTTEGPVLMLAGAGTGKTRALTTRLAHILATRKAAPWQVLAVTFTNKAAREMKERLGVLVGDKVEGMRWMGTFHSIAGQILRRHAELVDLKSSFTILDADDQVRLCKDLVKASNLDETRWPGRLLAGVIDGWKNRGLPPAQVPEKEAALFAEGRGIEFYRQYQIRLQELNAADFGDLLLHNLTIFQNHKDVLKIYQDRFAYMLVDEYQDTNVAQYLWLRLLSASHKNICVVGDDDQSIYGWRGAEVGNILRFEQDFPGAKIIRLEQNYRSTPAILGAASGLIAANKNRLGKTLWTASEDREKVLLRHVWDGEEEARLVCDEIEAAQGKGRSLSDMAVLVRTAAQMRSFEDRFNLSGIAYQVIGGPRFYEREETRDALAYLRLVRNLDDDLAFARIVNKPRRGIGEKALQTMAIAAREIKGSLHLAASQLLANNAIKGKAKNALGLFLAQLEQWRAQVNDLSATEIAALVLDDSGYTDYWKNSKNPQAPGKLENLKELVQAAGEFDSLPAWLDHVALVSELNENTGDGLVSLMTLHAAKGLEFPLVFLPGWEEGLFPSQRSLDENGLKGLEEERRLAYVGITRARERCFISFASNRLTYGRWQASLPSCFIDELPPEFVDIDSQQAPASNGQKAVFKSEIFNREDGSQHQIEGKAERVSANTKQSDFSVGERVFHQKFGMGSIRKIDGNKLDIAFDHAGEKRVIDSFITRP